MIELINNALVFRFPRVHSEATCTIDFQRTLRIPDDHREYPLPPGLGRFPVEHVDDFAERLPESWRQHGGVMIPMYQSEAMWVNFSGKYPCAVKIAAGKINAVSGKAWSNELSADPQDYVVIPEQPWLDGFNVSEDHIRQFVAMPLGEGHTAEEQITDEAQYGGLQIVVYPMKPEAYEQYRSRKQMVVEHLCCYSLDMDLEMGLAPGGLMKQEIYEDEYGIDSWDQEHGSRCFVHIANSATYETIVGRKPPHEPPTAKEYTAAGLPWFEYYADTKTLEGSNILGGLTSLAAKVIEKTGKPLQDNAPVEPKLVKEIHSNNIVREGEF
ncbi:MAG: hypothetical protein D6698_16470 [Gammaproteobacteria bacterium]|nr:MAG: hypothetical protein D6698_16470 [Gammaproteobacteria bacterium]